MVDKTVLATKVAAVHDAVARIREVRPASVEEFLAQRTTREVITLNIFVAVQESIALATHWLADAGWEVPQTHGDVFAALAAHGVIDLALAERLRAAAGLRNLIAHQYAVIDFERVFAMAARDVDDLLVFCQELARRASG